VKWIHLFFGLLLGMFWVAPVVFAQIEEEEEVTLLERVVVTATKAETPMKEVTRAVTVIPADRLNVDRGGFVSDVFSNVPETLVRRTGAIGRTTTVVIRGSNAQQVHVTIDGAHVASPTLGSFDFSNFSPINLERAEIMRGPGGTLYGSDAVGGVINFVTRPDSQNRGRTSRSTTGDGILDQTLPES